MSPAAAPGPRRLYQPVRAWLAAAAAIAVALLVALAVVSTASASTPANVTVTPSSFQSSNSSAGWTFSFDTSGTGALDGNIGDSVTLTFPAGFNVAGATATLGSEFVACTAGGTIITGQDVQVQLGTCTLAASTTGTVTVTGVTAPAATYAGSDFGVHTTRDTTVANASGSISLGVAATAVTFTPGSITPAGTPVTWTVGFTSSATGALTNPNTVTITFPAGVILPSSPASLQLTAGFSGTCGPGGATTGTVSGQTVTLTLSAGCTLPASTAATLDVQGITNPAAGILAASGFSLSTTTDPVIAHPASAVTIGTTAVSSVTFSGSSLAANHAATTWTAGFTTSGNGALDAGDSVSITFPAGFVLPAGTATVVLNASFLGTCPTTGTVASQTVTVNITGSCTLDLAEPATIDIQGITNPAAGTYSNTGFTISTSVDTNTVSPAAGATITPTSVTGVTFTPSSTTPAASASWTVGFTGSASGALAAAGTVAITFPGTIAVPATPVTVALNTLFAGTCLTTGSTSGQTVTITLPSGCSLGNSQAASITLQGFTNPGAGSIAASSFSVHTSKDETDVHPAAGVTFATPVAPTQNCGTNEVLVGSSCIARATITGATRVGTTLPIVVTLTGSGFAFGKTVVTATPTGGAAVSCAVSPEPTTPGAVQCTLPAVYASGTFTFAVTANGVAGVASTVSLTVLLGKPGAPTSFDGTIAAGTATLTWVAPAAVAGAAPVTGYTVTSVPASTGCTTTTALTCTITGLTAGKAYTFSVVALAGTLTSDPATVTVTPRVPATCGATTAAHPSEGVTVTFDGTQNFSQGYGTKPSATVKKELGDKLLPTETTNKVHPVTTGADGVACLATVVPILKTGKGTAKRSLTVSWTSGYGTIFASSTGGTKALVKVVDPGTKKVILSFSRSTSDAVRIGVLPPGRYVIASSNSFYFTGSGTSQIGVQLAAAPPTDPASCKAKDVVDPIAGVAWTFTAKVGGSSGNTDACGPFKTKDLNWSKQTVAQTLPGGSVTYTVKAPREGATLKCSTLVGGSKVTMSATAVPGKDELARLGPVSGAGKCTIKFGTVSGPVIVGLTR